MTTYTTATTDKLFNLLPAVLRERDAKEGYPLRALLRIIEEQAVLLEEDIEQLGRNAFIETCEPWVISYLASLVGASPLSTNTGSADSATAQELFTDLEGPSFLPPVALRSRTDTLKTIYYRRRKSTLPMLEELARDVTHWAAHTQEFFENIIWSQWVRNRRRMHAHATPNVRSVACMKRINSPFDSTCHSVDVRTPNQFQGWHNTPNIGIFLWRLKAMELPCITARSLGVDPRDVRYHVSVLGNDAPLFSKHRREGNPTSLATEFHVPQPINPATFHEDLDNYNTQPQKLGFTEFYGAPFPIDSLPAAPEASLFIRIDRKPVPPEYIRCRNLKNWAPPTNSKDVSLDITSGRLTLGTSWLPANPQSSPSVEVWCYQGFPGDLGGGTYARTAWLMGERVDATRLFVDASGNSQFTTIKDALDYWKNTLGKENTIISIRGNCTYKDDLTIDIPPTKQGFLTIEATDQHRPHLRLSKPLKVTGINNNFSLTLGGLLLEGSIHIEGSLGRLRLIHTTLVPGVSIAVPDPNIPPPQSSVVTEPSLFVITQPLQGSGTANQPPPPLNTEFRLEMAFSITGPLRIPSTAEGIFALDSVIDGAGSEAIQGSDAASPTPGPPLHLERSTILGAVSAQQIQLATEVIFDGRVTIERQQTGCIRFCYVPPGSQTPRRYRCQPDLAEQHALRQKEGQALLSQADQKQLRAQIRSRVRPVYSSSAYGNPFYLQLSLTCAEEIRGGAEDGSEMGVWCHLKQPQREGNLKQRLHEYLPFGLDPAIIYVT